MKWYYWLIIVVIAVLLFLIIRNQIYIEKIKKNIAKTQESIDVNQSIIDKSNNSRDIVTDLINKKLSFEEIKIEAAKKNVLVLDSKEIHTMEFNSRRVIIKQIVVNCLVPPCFDILTIESVG